MSDLASHMQSGLTTVCRCWAVTRRDGVVMGFTDHDLALSFEGITFRANAGLTARALAQTTGLSVDNTEAMGALSHDAITEADIDAGRYDGAEVRAWLVNWAAPDERQLQFRGTIGELRRAGGAFEAELRGLSEALGQPQGRVYQGPCGAVLGDGDCGFDLSAPGYRIEVAVSSVTEATVLEFDTVAGFDVGWFERGRLRVLSGAAQDLVGLIKSDRVASGVRVIELWQSLRAPIAPGDRVGLEAGCDKRADTCRLKFNNFLNFRGFPDIPGEDWLVSFPTRVGRRSGGSLRK